MIYNPSFVFTFSIPTMSLQLEMEYMGVIMTNNTTPVISFTNNQAANMISGTLSLNLNILNTAQFKSFVTAMVQSVSLPSSATTLTGLAYPNLNTNADIIPIAAPYGLSFTSPLGLNGLANMSSPPITINSYQQVDLIGAGGTSVANYYLKLAVICTVPNPSSASINMGPVNLFINYQNVQIGNVSVANFNLPVGGANFSATVYLYPTASNHTQFWTFLNLFLASPLWVDLPGANTLPIQLVGASASTAVALLQPALSTFVATTTIPGNPNLLTEVRLRKSLPAA